MLGCTRAVKCVALVFVSVLHHNVEMRGGVLDPFVDESNVTADTFFLCGGGEWSWSL